MEMGLPTVITDKKALTTEIVLPFLIGDFLFVNQLLVLLFHSSDSTLLEKSKKTRSAAK